MPITLFLSVVWDQDISLAGGFKGNPAKDGPKTILSFFKVSGSKAPLDQKEQAQRGPLPQSEPESHPQRPLMLDLSSAQPERGPKIRREAKNVDPLDDDAVLPLATVSRQYG